MRSKIAAGLPPASPDVRALLQDVRDRIIDLFGISADEATARIAAAFARVDLRHPWNERYLCSEDADSWAKTVVYGFDVDWWRIGAHEIPPWPPQ